MYKRWIVCIALALATVSVAACNRRFFGGRSRPSGRTAAIHLGDSTIRSIDGELVLGAFFGRRRIEVASGSHRIVLGFERTARSVGVRDVPAVRGEGTCTLDFVAEAGREYWLGSRALGTDWMMRRWDGKWEAWIRDAPGDSEDHVIVRCSSGVIAPKVASSSALAPVPKTAMPAPAAGAVVAVPAAPAVVPVVSAAVPIAPVIFAVAPTAARERWIRLGTWNVRSLGTMPSRDYAAVAAVIEGNFDILTLTEVSRVDGGHPGYDRLMSALAAGWAGLVAESPRSRGAAAAAESYAIVYRRDRVRPCSGWHGLRTVPDGGGATDAGRFERAPAFACFVADAGEAAGGVDFMLAAYRATSGDGDADVVAAEVGHIGDVFQVMATARPGDGDLIVAGQFNLYAAELATVTSAVDRTAGSGSTLSLLGEPVAGLRDHILVRDRQSVPEMVGDGVVLDVRGVAESPREFRRTVSDHLPVMVRIRAAANDDD